MIPVVTASEMREIDRRAIDDYGIPSLVLMERAGLSVVRRILERFGPSDRFIVLAGGGNNGGDGIVIGRELHNQGFDVRIFLLSPPERLSPDCKRQYETAGKYGVPIIEKRPASAKGLSGSVLIDAILGTGLNKPLREDLARVVDMVNQSHSTVVSVDIPTGISSDTGAVMGRAVYADMTVTFGLPKRGHLLPPGSEYSGELFIEDIGFPAETLEDPAGRCSLIEKADAPSLIPPRFRNSYKGTYGHVLIAGGSPGKTGALLLAGRAALRTGSGLVTLATEDNTTGLITPAVLEEMLLPLEFREGDYSHALDRIFGFLDERGDVLGIGPGLGRDELKRDFTLELITNARVPMVIDADALFHIASLSGKEMKKLFDNLMAPAILTPHHGEMGRLLKKGAKSLRDDPLEAARGFSLETGTVLVLKGAPTIVASPEGEVFLNSTGNPGMATAGSGDVLTGMIASLIGQGLPPLEAGILGVYLHGLAGDLAAGELGEHSLTAGDIINHIPPAYESL